MNDLAKRIPFRMTMHLNCGSKHFLDYLNNDLNVACSVMTRYRNGKPWKSERLYGLNKPNTKTYKTLAGLLRHNASVAKKAAALYPAK